MITQIKRIHSLIKSHIAEIRNITPVFTVFTPMRIWRILFFILLLVRSV